MSKQARQAKPKQARQAKSKQSNMSRELHVFECENVALG